MRQGLQLLGIHQVEFLHKDAKVLETRVQVRLRRQGHDLVEVAVVNVRVHAEQPLENDFHCAQKRLWEGNICTARE